MDDRTCKRCGKEFRAPSYLLAHERRKTPCEPILNVEDLPPGILEDPDLEKKKCHFCGRVFSSYASMRRHIRNACKIAPNAKNGGAGMEVLYEHTIRRQQAQIEAQQVQIATMMEMMRDMARTGTQTANGVAVQGDHAAIDNSKKEIHIHIHGQEALDHITPARIRAILDETLGGPAARTDVERAAQTAVLKTAMLVYSDPDHPENLTAYLPNKKTNDVLVRTSREGSSGWEVQPASLVLPPMAQKSVDTLFDHQPYEDAECYGPLMKELAANEARYVAGHELRPILVRNKDLLARVLETLPVAGAV